MTQEIKSKLEQAAEKYEIELYDILLEEPCQERVHFKAGAQTILDNPHDFGLVSQGSFNKKELFRKAWRERAAKAESQLTKYREALERIANAKVILHDDFSRLVAKEALKQEDATCPKCGYPLFKHLSKTCCQGCDYVKQK